MDCGDPTGNLTSLQMQYESGTVPNDTTYLITTSIICIPPYYFSDGTMRNSINCLATGIWSSILPCICMTQSVELQFSSSKTNNIANTKIIWN